MFSFELIPFITQLLCTTILLLLTSWYLYYRYCFTYWSRKGLPTKQPIFPAGNLTKSLIGQENMFVHLQNLYLEFKNSGHKHAGLYFFNGPIYFPISPDLVKRILTTDFDYFMDRGTYYNEDKYPLTTHMFSMSGKSWKDLRTKLSPTFTSGKMKAMYQDIFMMNTVKLINNMRTLANGRDDLNIKSILSSFTADIISASAFGVDSNTLDDEKSEFSYLISKIFNPPMWLFVRCTLEEGFKNPGNIIKAMHADRNIEKLFTFIVKETIKYRDENNIVRNDFLTLLLNVRDKFGLTMNQIVAQSYLFFMAGFETSSSTMSYALHELAHNPDIQTKLRREIYENLGDDFTKFTYDDLLKLPYLDKIVKETLRLYPVVGILNRICVKSYKVPGTDVVIDEGTPVLISTLGLQRDPEYFPGPLKFDPERFSDKNTIVPYTYLPFGEGPRVCIGMRYGLLQTKLGLAALVSKYKFLPSDRTPRVIEYDKIPTTLSMFNREGMFLKADILN